MSCGRSPCRTGAEKLSDPSLPGQQSQDPAVHRHGPAVLPQPEGPFGAVQAKGVARPTATAAQTRLKECEKM
ncbi:MAG: hypothetical protein MZU79_09180 [Anaerotruncus sp.]|nr:hypothetical protein [Anaerotruncus sp.]